MILKKLPISVSYLKFLIGLMLFANLSVAYASSIDSIEHRNILVENHFKSIIYDINQTLSSKQKEFENSPAKLVKYVDEVLIPIWSSSKTMSGLLGKKYWKGISIQHKTQLISSFNDTLQRYVQEGFKLYDGQRLEFVNVKLHPQKAYGFLTVKVIPTILPSFNVDFKIRQIESNWVLYDVMVKGVSYIKLKKDSFRKLHESKGVEGVLSSVNEKNKGYLQSSYRPKTPCS
ncbi:MlaC/ttg2D family ABC transporter substrate-binding protein [Aliikangiella coralliicola]|uniref:ABC transporter substrate-binding protein n=1 Tax=Aliikangiella coralliicola TaxID=2592383 RepID=A0A545U0J9_9GAMM|nr:ABC transporter substrate-binding protein [Aliikangiella coralliicola]TQV82998.1 ABC transporter substrate-binding protein [Aliikangiella coralliicola]